MLESIKEDYFCEPPKFTIDRTKEYLAGKGFSPSLIRKYSTLFRDFIIEEQISKKFSADYTEGDRGDSNEKSV